MKKNLFLLFFVLAFSCVLSAETTLFIEYLSDNEEEIALSVVGRIEIKDEIFRLIDINGEELASCNLYEVRKLSFKDSIVGTNFDEFDFSNSIIAYPNPTKDILFIEGLKSNEIVRIYDLDGRLVTISESNNEGMVVLSVSSLTEGIYLMQVGVEIVKFIKK